MDNNWMVLLQQQNLLARVMETNQTTAKYGLVLSESWYDAEFEPQNTILTLDYPVLKDLSVYSGIDRVYEFIACVRAEKILLELFSEDYVINILRKYNCDYQDMFLAERIINRYNRYFHRRMGRI